MSMNLGFLRLVIVLALVHVVYPVQRPEPPAEIWDRVVRAKGGRERLHAVHTLAWSSDDLSPSGPRRVIGSAQLEFVEAYPDRCWSWEDYRPGSLSFRVEVWNARKQQDWESIRGGQAKRLPWTNASAQAMLQIRQIHQVLFLLESAFIQPKPVAASERGGVIHLEATAAGFVAVRYEIDPSTYLPRVITIVPELTPLEGGPPFPGLPLEYVLEGYRLVDGVQMPSRVGGFGEVRFVINPVVDPALFETPPDGVRTRDAWREFLRK